MNKITSDELLIIVIASSTTQWYQSESRWPPRDLTTQTSSDSWADVLREFDMETNDLRRTKKVSNMEGNSAPAGGGGGGSKPAPVKPTTPAEPPGEGKNVKKVEQPKQEPNQKTNNETCQETKAQQNADVNSTETPPETAKEVFNEKPRNLSKKNSGMSKRSGKSLHRSEPLLMLFATNEPKKHSSDRFEENVDSNYDIDTFALLEQAGMGLYEDYLFRRFPLTRSKLQRHQNTVYGLLNMALNYVRRHPYVVEALQYVREQICKMLTYNKTATFFTGFAGIILLIVFIVKHAAVFCIRLFLEILLYAFIIDVMLC